MANAPTYAMNVDLGVNALMYIFIVAVLISAIVIALVARNAGRRFSEDEFKSYKHKIEGFEKYWVLFVIAVIVVLNVVTFNYTPQIVNNNYLSELGVNTSSLVTACPTVPPGHYQNACTSVIEHDISVLLPLQNEGKIMIVVVIAGQWYWHFFTVAPNGSLIFTNNLTIPANKPVVFIMTSVDVNHDFGVYDQDGNLLFQYQVTPDYVSIFTYEFTTPGPFIVRCLEYCGPGHWLMYAGFTVASFSVN